MTLEFGGHPQAVCHSWFVNRWTVRASSFCLDCVQRAEEKRRSAATLGGNLLLLGGSLKTRGNQHMRKVFVAAIAAINAANEALIRNPNEVLWLQALLMKLS